MCGNSWTTAAQISASPFLPPPYAAVHTFQMGCAVRTLCAD